MGNGGQRSFTRPGVPEAMLSRRHELKTIQEVLRLMGLLESAYWLGHYLTGVIAGTLSSGLVIACMVLVKKEVSYFPLERTSVSLLAVTFFFFCCLYTMHAMLVASFFRHASIAVTFGVIYWFPLTLFLPWQMVEGFESPLGAYIYADRHFKLLSSATPCLGTYWVLKIIGLSVDYTGGGSANWELITKNVLEMDNVSILEIWSVMAATCVTIALFLWYFTKIFPWTAGIPQPFYFPVTLKRSFLLYILQEFGELKALDGVDLKAYPRQITVLLGHNGAGKTTLMNIVTGMFSPTKGKVIVCGIDVAKNTERARENVSFCQQHNVFFSDLTVWEHLMFFGSLKGVHHSVIREKISRVLETVKLSDKCYSFCNTLSGGMKKRLSVAIATISSPKGNIICLQVIVLDEPSAGMDPENRRDMWSLFLHLRKRSTLIISTHDMEEADTLADNIVVMRRGKVHCSGSPSFLKKAFGYRLTIEKNDAVFQLDRVIKIVRQFVSTANVQNDKLNEVTLDLGVSEPDGFTSMFESLERHSEELGVQSIGVKVTTIEDVYVNNLYMSALNAPFADADLRAVSCVPPKRPTALGRFSALLAKRRLYFSRVWTVPVVCWVVPTLVFLGQLKLEHDLVSKRNSVAAMFNFVPPIGSRQRLKVDTRLLYPEGNVFLDHDNFSSEFVSRHFGGLADESVPRLVTLSSAQDELVSIGSRNFLEYTGAYTFGCVFWGDPLEALWNPYATLSSVIALNALNSAVLRYLSDDAGAKFQMNIQLDKEENSAVGSGLDFSKAAWRDMLEVALLMFSRAVFVPLGTAFVVAASVLFPVAESASGVRALQLMTGVSALLFWASHFLFDLLVYLLAWSAAALSLNLHYELSMETNAALLILVLVFSLVGISTSYAVASFAKSAAGAFTFVVLFFFFGGATPLFVFMVLMMLRVSEGLPSPRWIPLALLPLPPFTFPWSVIKVLQLDSENSHCLRYSTTKVGDLYVLDMFCVALQNGHRFPGGIHYCCERYASNSTVGVDTLSPLSFHEAGVALEILVMAAEGVLLFAFIVWKDSGPRNVFPSSRSKKTNSNGHLDADVQREKDLVQDMRVQSQALVHTMVVDDLHKVYGSLHAVQGLNLAVRSGECVGLLGVNGAGKTTTFQMLAGLLPATSGDAFRNDVVLSKQPRKWQSNIGYCPQSEGLLAKLTAFEFLRLFACLRGVPGSDVELLVASIINVVKLAAHAHKRCETYSGGNRRKLSIAAALLGLPGLVFLDEPTAGIDVVARKDIFRALERIKRASGVSIVLTSHSMAECELACDRIGIMVTGQFRCLGTLPHLKSRFGQGYVMSVKVAAGGDVDFKMVREAVQKVFPRTQLRHFHGGRLEYLLEAKIPWSEVFGKVDVLRQSLQLEHVLISDTTLEQIFIGFADANQGDLSSIIPTNALT
ncbi:ATP-binding cassette sub-family A member 2-like [Ixodes scapularis]|uniref:ATP-binding cassette sub-family A member 2-like n=1 Tax=Ixodes scapularis TaxID=6945 RepID=UPI001C383A84|nr:ATP-binding cassette sub-family A member 2-like [Ixodes scapularis]